MHKKDALKPLAAAIGVAVASTLAVGSAANAAENPFGLSQLDGGYLQSASGNAEGNGGGKMKMKDGRCGEGMCGGNAEEQRSQRQQIPSLLFASAVLCDGDHILVFSCAMSAAKLFGHG